ncbi:hypothetical protein OR571_13145 [Psychrobacillus sp. NEAU-3TGS]|uniref:hypothetical protein n=1 Tax=Psychrobacillus sp. NEAU-3TGS TaxID=2995412 RepID=UPI002498697F|nr:hypothetical protein [Psychrobacillus sp. NEAU-3TGS]MDI2588034.1 hypothetical protein [Psychrobacillus sp. NEAU-3TGS]
MSVKISKVQIITNRENELPAQTTFTGETVFIEVEVFEKNWLGIKSNFKNWNDVKNAFSNWLELKNW